MLADQYDLASSCQLLVRLPRCAIFVRFGKLSGGASTSSRRAGAAVDKITSARGLRAD